MTIKELADTLRDLSLEVSGVCQSLVPGDPQFLPFCGISTDLEDLAVDARVESNRLINNGLTDEEGNPIP